MKKGIISNALIVCTITMISQVAASPQLKQIASGLKEPVWATAPKKSTKYFYIVEKPGTIKIQDRRTGQILPKPFLDISNKIRVRMNEQGLLGMAFCPNFEKTGRFYLNYTDNQGTTQISRFKCNPNLPILADPGTEERILTIQQDSRNHNGGWIGFGPDNYLYIGMGDGGGGNDPKNRAQDMTQLLGKLLRIDVNQKQGYSVPKSNPFVGKKGVKPEIFALGLRNPWRCCFDPTTNDFYAADVGQNKYEEINFLPHSKLKGADFGWRLREGKTQTPRKNVGGPKKPNHIEPVYTYGRGGGHNQGYSVTGGVVYRGKIKSLSGHYFFADWANPRIWSFKMSKGKTTQFKDWTEQLKLKPNRIFKISSFAQDPQGEVYIIDFNKGAIFKIVE